MTYLAGEWAFYDYSDGMIRLRISDIQIFLSDVSPPNLRHQ